MYFLDKEGADKLMITGSYTEHPVRGPIHPVTDPTAPSKFYIFQNCTEPSRVHLLSSSSKPQSGSVSAYFIQYQSRHRAESETA